jgi:hypothetical protein
MNGFDVNGDGRLLSSATAMTDNLPVADINLQHARGFL